jgi:small subunit ribosomal protein S2
MSNQLSLQDLLKAGAHFGHQTYKWNPKMKKYIHCARNGVYIIDLGQTINLAKKAYDFLNKVSSEGRPVLFVGTKRQASETVKNAAESCGAFFVTHRWLGGMLTNYKTITLSVDKIRKVEKMKENGDFDLLTKKERSKVEKDVIKLERNLGGIKEMRKLPGAIFIVDPNNERIAIQEANTLGIPVVAITDTNCNPDGISYVVPGNDDAIKSISLFADYFAESVSSGSKKVKNKAGTSSSPDTDASLEKEIISKYEKDIDLIAEGDAEVVEVVEETTEK